MAKWSRRSIIILAVVIGLLILGGGSAAAWWFWYRKSSKPDGGISGGKPNGGTGDSGKSTDELKDGKSYTFKLDDNALSLGGDLPSPKYGGVGVLKYDKNNPFQILKAERATPDTVYLTIPVNGGGKVYLVRSSSPFLKTMWMKTTGNPGEAAEWGFSDGVLHDPKKQLGVAVTNDVTKGYKHGVAAVVPIRSASKLSLLSREGKLTVDPPHSLDVEVKDYTISPNPMYGNDHRKLSIKNCSSSSRQLSFVSLDKAGTLDTKFGVVGNPKAFSLTSKIKFGSQEVNMPLMYGTKSGDTIPLIADNSASPAYFQLTDDGLLASRDGKYVAGHGLTNCGTDGTSDLLQLYPYDSAYWLNDKFRWSFHSA